MKPALWICLCVLLAGVVRCHNLREVFVEGHVYFVDADCYSRMTRARIVDANPGSVVGHHRFENFPAGTDPHTTAPMDYAIVGLGRVLKHALPLLGSGLLGPQSLDVAGALISPLLGMLTCGFLGLWATRAVEGKRRWWRAFIPGGGAVPLVFAVSPILVHGTVLGRPDHQSLLILLLAVALGAEWRLAGNSSKLWAALSGLAWALALWVSLYEPLVLFAAVLLAWLTGAPRRLLSAERKSWLVSFVAILGAGLLIDGWRVHPLDPALVKVFPHWAASIGELGHPNLWVLFRWLGWGCVLTPVLLVLAGRRGDAGASPSREQGRRGDDGASPSRGKAGQRAVFAGLGLFLLTVALTVWQARWGYFLALVFVMALPWQLGLLRKSWLAWGVLILSLWPVAREWDEQLFPPDAAARQRELQRAEAVLLREVALRMRSTQEQAFLAPWWLSPALAYWSGQPGVAGSSHESLAGIVDSARFYLDEGVAVPVLRQRQVAWVVADEPSRVIDNSRLILDLTQAPPVTAPLAELLIEQPHSAARYLRPVFANQFFKLFSVDPNQFPP